MKVTSNPEKKLVICESESDQQSSTINNWMKSESDQQNFPETCSYFCMRQYIFGMRNLIVKEFYEKISKLENKGKSLSLGNSDLQNYSVGIKSTGCRKP